jgi:hypothetical protein
MTIYAFLQSKMQQQKKEKKQLAKLIARKGRIFQNDEAKPKNVTEPLDIQKQTIQPSNQPPVLEDHQ